MFTKCLPYICVSFLLSTVFVSCGAAQSEYRDPDAYTVYAAIIEKEWTIEEVKAEKLVIQSETEDHLSNHGQKMCLKPAPGDEQASIILKAFQQANEKPWLLQRLFDIPQAYQLVSKLSVQEIIGKDFGGWPKFFEKYPDSGGSIHMSAVGFNGDKTQALVYMGHWCGSLCGGGGYHRLEKKDGKWREIPWNGEGCSWNS